MPHFTVCLPHSPTNPSRSARVTAWAREVASSFLQMLRMCALAVCTLMPSRAASDAADAALNKGSEDAERSPDEWYNSAMDWQDRISVNPAVRSGKPCIKGTRITVYDVLEYLAGGMSEDEILSDFPDLTREDIRASLAFAAARERRLANSVA